MRVFIKQCKCTVIHNRVTSWYMHLKKKRKSLSYFLCIVLLKKAEEWICWSVEETTSGTQQNCLEKILDRSLAFAYNANVSEYIAQILFIIYVAWLTYCISYNMKWQTRHSLKLLFPMGLNIIINLCHTA